MIINRPFYTGAFGLDAGFCFRRSRVDWFFLLRGPFAGIRVGASAAQTLPLCGAAPTFLCRRKEK
jgi:hypothetical protein